MDDYQGWSDEDLEAERARLAGERTRIREAQVAAAAEIEVRAALKSLSPNAQARLVRINVGGSIGVDATAAHEEVRS